MIKYPMYNQYLSMFYFKFERVDIIDFNQRFGKNQSLLIFPFVTRRDTVLERDEEESVRDSAF